MRTYARFLAEDASDDSMARIRELCENLIGLPDSEGDIKVLNISGRKLLKEDVLPAVARNRALQGMVGYFHDTLNILSS